MDNEGIKFCLMKGSSDNAVVDIICAIFTEMEWKFMLKRFVGWPGFPPIPISQTSPPEDPCMNLLHKVL